MGICDIFLIILSSLRLDVCQFKPGDGQGGKEVDIAYLTRDQCVQRCKEERKKDQTVNGATYGVKGQYSGYCTCEYNMIYWYADDKFESCMFAKAGKKYPGDNMLV